ncbi:MAG: class I SAM-dependent methyltransferase [Corynebacteriales bacterium]|nr:class I SAM-dependent methyltransferase [Mycobacteriales bacterium]
MSTSSDDQRHTGLGFYGRGDIAARYRARPGYPRRSAAWAMGVLSRIRAQDAQRSDGRLFILDAGCGTGQVSEALAKTGLGNVKLMALDPFQEMLENRLPRAAHVPGTVGVFEALPFREESFDGIFVGTALHRGNPEKTPKELHRVLRGSGVVATFYNVIDKETFSYQAISGSHLPLPADLNTMTSEISRGGKLNLGGGFTHMARSEWRRKVQLTPAEFRSYLQSRNDIGTAAPELQHQIWKQVESNLSQLRPGATVPIVTRTIVNISQRNSFTLTR